MIRKIIDKPTKISEPTYIINDTVIVTEGIPLIGETALTNDGKIWIYTSEGWTEFVIRIGDFT